MRDNQLTETYDLKDIFNKSAKLQRKPAIEGFMDDLTTDNKIDNESWRYHRKWRMSYLWFGFFSGRSIAKRCLLLTTTISYNSL